MRMFSTSVFRQFSKTFKDGSLLVSGAGARELVSVSMPEVGHENVLDSSTNVSPVSIVTVLVTNLDALRLTNLDCVVHTTFYSKLMFATLTPIGISVCIYTYRLAYSRLVTSTFERQRVRDLCVEIFLGLTYMIFSGTSTTIFNTFNCVEFGDDPKSYLALDPSLDCGSVKHRLFSVYAAVMVFVYPLGIPALYTFLLVRKRKSIASPDRIEDRSLLKTSFLWDMYEPNCWW